MNTNFGVIFDMDGVVVHSNPAHKKNIQSFFKKYDLEVTEEQLREQIYGRQSREWIPDIFGASEEETEQLIQEKGRKFREQFDPRAAAIPGVLNFLDELKDRGIPTVLATSATKENVEFNLSELSIESQFEAVLNADDVDQGKPDPEVYLKASEAIGYKPQKCIVIEDSISGVEAGKQAGSKVIGVTSTHAPEEMEDCDLIIGDFRGLSVQDLYRLVNRQN